VVSGQWSVCSVFGVRIRKVKFLGSAGFQPVPLKFDKATFYHSQAPGWESPFWSKKLLRMKDFEEELRLKMRPQRELGVEEVLTFPVAPLTPALSPRRGERERIRAALL